MQLNPVGIKIFGIQINPAPVLAEVHDIADVGGWREDIRSHERFLRRGNQRRVWVAGRVVNPALLPVGQLELVHNARQGGDNIEIELPLEPLLYDLHMQKPEEPAPETKPQRNRGFGFKRKGGIVELQLFKRIPQVGIFRTIERVDTRKDHRLHLAIAGQRFRSGILCIGDRIADRRIPHSFNGSREVADLPCKKLLPGDKGGRAHNAAFDYGKFGPGGHHADLHTWTYGSFLDPHIDDDPFVTVIVAVEDQRTQRGFRLPRWSRDIGYNPLEHRMDILPGLGGNTRRIKAGQPDHVLHFMGNPFRFSRRQVDLVDDRHHFQVMLDRKIGVGEGLRLDPLRCIDDQHRTFTGGQ